MDSLSFTKLYKVALLSLFLTSTVTAAVALNAYQFRVGGRRGWIRPSSNDTDVYNEWARKTRFHIGDSLLFKYKNDSVLLVNHEDYKNCFVFYPISKFVDGNTSFQFDRHGFFYFISGNPGHCQAGQKVIVRVMVHPRIEVPDAPAESPKAHAPGVNDGRDSSGWGTPSVNSADKLSVASYFMTVLLGVFIVLLSLI